MKALSLSEVIADITHIRGGVPLARLARSSRLAGHRSTFFGPSYDFVDIQEYDPDRDPPNQIIYSLGDEDTIYARKCIEEHETQIVFLVDLSSSIDSGQGLAKRKMLLSAIGCIGLTGARAQDPVGLIGFTDRIILDLPKRCGNSYVYYLVQAVYDLLAELNPSTKRSNTRKTDFAIALASLQQSVARPSVIVMISDFVEFDQMADSALLAQVAARHELLLVFLDDPVELTSGLGLGYMRTEDIETGRQHVVSRRKLAKMEKELRQRRKEMRGRLGNMGITSVVLEPNKLFKRLQKFFTIQSTNTART